MRSTKSQLRFLASLAHFGLHSLCMLGLLSWLLGRVVSDRYGWSQWLLWIPTPFVVVVALAGAVVSAVVMKRLDFSRRRRTVVAGYAGSLVLIVMYFSFVEFRLFRQAPEPVGLKLVHWTAPADRDTPPDWAQRIIQWDGDITLLQGAQGTWHDERVIAWLGPDVQPVTLSHFCVLSKFPLLEVRALIYRLDILIVYSIVVQHGLNEGESLRIWLVDLPADPQRSKSALVDEALVLLASIDEPEPDLIVGDCNMTRNSWQLRRLFPNRHHAYDDGGHGYSATFPRAWPLYHIDQMLLSRGWRASRYDVIDPGAGRHRAHMAWLQRGQR